MAPSATLEAHVLYACQSQIAQVMLPVLRQPNQCESMALGRKVLLVGENIVQGLRRWSRIAEWCTQAQLPRPAGAALCLLPRPASVIWCLVCLWWCVGNAGRREMGGDEVF